MPDLATPVSPQDHTEGPASAPVTLVEYGDFQCPTCGQAYPIVKQLQKELGDKLRFVYRNYPLEQHPFAEPAAEAAEFAATQDKFWPMHDALYQHQRQLSEELFPKLARELSLDPEALTSAIEDQTFADRIEADMQGADDSGLRGTPTFYINGKQHTGSFAYDDLLAAIQAAS